MEIILITVIFGFAVFAMTSHIIKTFNKGEKCSSCSSEKGDCCS